MRPPFVCLVRELSILFGDVAHCPCILGHGCTLTGCFKTCGLQKFITHKVSSSYHLCVECFSQLSFDSEVYTKSAAVAYFVYTSESNDSCEKHSTQR